MSEVDRLRHGVVGLLLIWGIASIIIGAVLSLGSPSTILGGIGLQAVIWGVIDGVIGILILFRQREQSIARIAKTVSASIRFDITFLVVGIVAALIFLQNPYYMGNGIGVVIQGLFLFLLDSSYLRRLKNLEMRIGTQDS